MTPQPSAAVTEILFEALEREGEDRRAYLDQACGQDDGLRREVESLLRVDDSDGISRFLAKPVLENTSVAEPAPELMHADESALEAPDRVGPFRVLKRLGVGGMGAVYLAQQDEPIERRVAIKVVHALHHTKWRQRFTAECQALARLNHPHIAALHEVGTIPSPSGVHLPYVAMELIDGESITDWCDRERAGLELRLKVFLDVCSGISHAHQNGILHCDLKPANILVTRADGRAKVIDFGIARAVDDLPAADSVTQDILFGSPPYITPEMMEEGSKALDTRTDVYALGLILYELLVGALPFRASSTWLLMLQISEKEPEAPSARFEGLTPEEQDQVAAARKTHSKALSGTCRGDLDAIVLKAIDRDPDRRYGSTAEKSFVVSSWSRGRRRFFILGQYGKLTLPQAREATLEVFLRVRRGEDPSGDKQAARRDPTVADLADRHVREHSEIKKKPRNAERDRTASSAPSWVTGKSKTSPVPISPSS